MPITSPSAKAATFRTIQWCISIRGTLPTVIGEYVTVGHGAIVHACTLQDRSFVGMGAIVLDGAVVESGAMVAQARWFRLEKSSLLASYGQAVRQN